MIDLKRTMVAALVGLVMLVAWEIPLPGLDPVWLDGQLATRSDGLPPSLSIFALWIKPLLTAMVLVELVRLASGAKGQVAGALEIAAVALIASVITIFVGNSNATIFWARGFSDASYGKSFIWLTLATYVGMTLICVILCYRVRMPGFRHSFWLLWSVPLLEAMPSQVGAQFEFVRTGAGPASNWLIFGAFQLLAFVAVVAVTALWRSVCTPKEQTHESGFGVPLDILIWPVFLATWIAETAMSVAGFFATLVLPVLSEDLYALWTSLAQPDGRYLAMIQVAFTVLLIPFLVVAYLWHGREDRRADAPVMLIATMIALVQIALLVVPEVLKWNLGIWVHGTGLIAITLTMLALRKASTSFVRQPAPATA